ncbi:MAG: hypothetical protein ACD_46C00163G0002 [uncultured bacterium]|nr:MAG: hypothetical protein ACD_46C00163G0002 [uncultured bacterium]
MKNCLKAIFKPAVASLFGVLLAISFAPFDIFPLAILAPAGLLFLLLGVSPKRAFWLGFSFGLGLFGAGVYWVYISVHTFGDVLPILAGLITAALVGILALFPATACYLSNRYFPVLDRTKNYFAFAACWVLIEWIRSWLFTGFPWLFVGYSQTNSPLKGFAPIFSVYGVSLAALICSSLIVFAFLFYQQKNYRRVYINLFTIACIFTIGGLLSLIPWTTSAGKPIRVSLVQGNIPQSLKWSPDHLSLSFERYQQLTETLWNKSQIIIWPEAAIPMTLQNAQSFINEMDKKARENNTHLILGIPIKNENGIGYYNAIVSVGSDLKVYLKRRLVPFGEYIPFEKYFSRAFSILDIPLANMQAGKPFQAPLEIDGIKILPSICYEIAFPELIRSTDKNIGLLLTVTNDAWFGKSTAQAQHLQMAAMRAIEMGRPVLFASNDGITAVITPDGRIDTSAPAYEPTVLSTTVQPTKGLTPWMTNGIDPILFILLVIFVISVFEARAFKKQLSNVTVTQPIS